MSEGLPRQPRDDTERKRYERSLSLLRGGGVGIALVAAATAGLVAVAGLIALLVTALY